MEKVDLVIVGAEGVVENGGIINKVGALPRPRCPWLQGVLFPTPSPCPQACCSRVSPGVPMRHCTAFQFWFNFVQRLNYVNSVCSVHLHRASCTVMLIGLSDQCDSLPNLKSHGLGFHLRQDILNFVISASAEYTVQGVTYFQCCCHHPCPDLFRSSQPFDSAPRPQAPQLNLPPSL